MNRFAFASLLILSAACSSTSHKESEAEQQRGAEAQFEHIKSLEGEWSGRAIHGQAEVQRVDVNYKVTAGGSAVVETLFPNTDHEMVTVYHMDGDHLVLTHYCVMGNQPRMVATPFAAPVSGPLVIDFDYAGGTNMGDKNAAHMHSAEIEFLGKDHIETKWKMYKDDKEVNEAAFDLVRQDTYH
jgi:hypothetical protein